MSAWIYIIANRYRGTMYIGVTANLAARSWRHRHGAGSQFAARYGVSRLVYVEEFPTMLEAIAREKQLKHWNRDWKIDLIEQANPDWNDLFQRINS